jgi:hypothetical protein
MSRRSAMQSASGGIQLFPFLAVLICTMGSLVVVLVAMARQGQLQALASAMVAQRADDDSFRDERESIEWEISHLIESRKKTEAQLADGRLELSHIEDHLRRLRERAEELRVETAELHGDTNASQSAADAERELAALNEKISKLQDELRARATTGKQVSYSIVPYEGPNQTRRRPIYIECRADAILLQPEGVRLTEADFSGPLTAGNPLAAAMRAEREYLKQVNTKDAGEPYPLLVVRPDGISAYYAARAALSSWDTDFGYELVEADWQLDFLAADPQLAVLLEKVLADSRLRQEALMRAAPRPYGKPIKRSFAAQTAGPDSDGPLPGGNSGGAYAAQRGSAGASQPSGSPITSGAAAAPKSARESAGPEQPGQAPHKTKKEVDSLSKQRGENWGLPDATNKAVPLTRPITIECYADRLVVVPENAKAEAKQVPLGENTEDAIDLLVSSVWDQMKSWGIAGRNLYWRPTLVMKVAPDAGHRYDELKKLLEDSGLDVKQKGESTARRDENPLRGARK